MRKVLAGGCGGGVGFEEVGEEVHGVFAILEGDVGVVAGVVRLILWK
jgi:hypothetical protein